MAPFYSLDWNSAKYTFLFTTGYGIYVYLLFSQWHIHVYVHTKITGIPGKVLLLFVVSLLVIKHLLVLVKLTSNFSQFISLTTMVVSSTNKTVIAVILENKLRVDQVLHNTKMLTGFYSTTYFWNTYTEYHCKVK